MSSTFNIQTFKIPSRVKSVSCFLFSAVYVSNIQLYLDNYMRLCLYVSTLHWTTKHTGTDNPNKDVMICTMYPSTIPHHPELYVPFPIHSSFSSEYWQCPVRKEKNALAMLIYPSQFTIPFIDRTSFVSSNLFKIYLLFWIKSFNSL